MEFSPESHWAEKYITHPWEWEKTLINRIWESNNTMLDETMNGIKNNVFDQIENKILLESLKSRNNLKNIWRVCKKLIRKILLFVRVN